MASNCDYDWSMERMCEWFSGFGQVVLLEFRLIVFGLCAHAFQTKRTIKWTNATIKWLGFLLLPKAMKHRHIDAQLEILHM